MKIDMEKVKYITRTIDKHYKVKQLVPNMETLQFEEKEITVWDEELLPKGKSVISIEEIPATLYRIPIEIFMKYAEKVPEK